MDKFNERSSNSDLYARIKALPLTASQRETALSALRNGAIVADSILWVMNGIKRLPASATLKPAATTKQGHNPATRWHRNLGS
jgi:hypothetical protein